MSRRAALLFVALGVLWGLPYLLIKVAVRETSPALLVFVRTGGAATILLPLAARAGQVRSVLSRWRPLLAFAVAELVVPWYLLFNAERRLSSSLSGLLVATVPLIGALLAVATGSDRLDRRRVGGLALGLTGVAALVGFDVGRSDLLSAACLVLVAAGYAVGPWILSRHLADQPRLGVMAVTLATTAVLYAPFALTELPQRPLSGEVVASLVTLTVLCTALAFVLMFSLVEEIGAMRATVITYVNPAVAVVLGATLLHEHVGIVTVAGFVLIIAGSIWSTGAARPPGDPAAAGIPGAPAGAGVPPPAPGAPGEATGVDRVVVDGGRQ